MNKMRPVWWKRHLICRQAREIPRWMYFVRGLVYISCGVADLFLTPFGKVSGWDMVWQGKMLRSTSKRR